MPPVAPPRLPRLDVPPQGPDSAPALGLIQDPTAAPPPPMPPLILPPELPQDPVQQAALLQRFQEQVRNEVLRKNYELDLAIQNEVAMAPQMVADLQNRMLLDPEAEGADYDREIDEQEPFTPPSRIRELRSRRKVYKVTKEKLERLDRELTELLKTKQPGDLKSEKEVPVTPVDWENVKMGGQNILFGANAEIMRAAAERDRAQPPKMVKSDAAVQQSPTMADVGRSLTSMFTGESTPGQEMIGRAKKLIETMLPIGETPEEAEQWKKMALDRLGPAVTDDRPAWDLPEGVTKEMMRGALTQQAHRTIDRLKGDAPFRDFAGHAMDVATLAIPVAGEIKASSMVAKAVLPKLLKGLPRLAKAGEVITTYMAGPSVIEAARAGLGPLPAEVQQEIDEIQDTKLRETTEKAHRILLASQAATTGVIFSFTDALRGFGTLKPKPGLWPKVRSTVGVGLSMPAVMEGTDLAAEALFGQPTGEGGSADAIAWMMAAGGRGKPVKALLGAAGQGDWAAFKAAGQDYLMQAAPMVAGLGMVHLASAFAPQLGKLKSRAEMLAMKRKADADVDKLVKQGGLDEVVGEEIKKEVGRRLEEMSPTHAEDERRIAQDEVTEAFGEQGESQVIAEDMGEALLPEVKGTPAEKVKALEEQSIAKPDDPDVQRDLGVARLLEEAETDPDPASAWRTAAMARKKKLGVPDQPIEEAQEQLTTETNVKLTEKPGARDKALKTVAKKAKRKGKKWQVVSENVEEGTITAQQAPEVVGEAPVRKTVRKPQRKSRTKSMLTRIVELGGLSHETMKKFPGDVRSIRETIKKRGLRGVIRSEKSGAGMRWEHMAQALASEGFIRKNDEGVTYAGQGDDAGVKFSEMLRDVIEGNVRVVSEQDTANEAEMQREYQHYLEQQGPQADDEMQRAIDAVRHGGTISARTLGDAMGVNKNRANKLLNEMVEHGILKKDERGFHLTEEVALPSEIKSEQDAREERARNLTVEMTLDATEIANDMETAGIYKTENLERLQHNLLEYATVSRPDDPDAGHAQGVALVLDHLPESMHTSEFIKQKLGSWNEEAVRAALLERRPTPAPEVAEEVRIAVEAPGSTAKQALVTDLAQAVKKPTLDALPEAVQEAFSAAKDAGKRSQDVAEAAWKEWVKDNRAFGHKTHADFVNHFRDRLKKLDGKQGITSSRPHLRRAAFAKVAELVRDLEGADQISALASMTSHGRKVLQRLQALKRMMTQELEVKPEPEIEMPAESAAPEPFSASRARRAILGAAKGEPELPAAKPTPEDAARTQRVKENIAALHEPSKKPPKTQYGSATDEFYADNLAQLKADLDGGYVQPADASAALDAVGVARGELEQRLKGTESSKDRHALKSREKSDLQDYYKREAKKDRTEIAKIKAAMKLADELLANLGKRKSEAGSTIIPTEMARAIALTLWDGVKLAGSILRWTHGKAFRTGMRLLSGALKGLRIGVDIPLAAAWKLVGRTREARRLRDARRVRQRSLTVLSKHAGRQTHLKKAAKTLVDRLSKWGEVDAILAGEEAGALHRLAHEAMELLHKNLLKENRPRDLQFNRWLEIKGKRRPSDEERVWSREFEGSWTQKEKDLADAVREMYRSLLDIVRAGKLPSQILRRRDLAFLDKVRGQIESQVDAAAAVVEQTLTAREEAAAEAAAEGVEKKKHDGWKAAQKRVEQAKRHLKAFREKLDAHNERIQHLLDEGRKEASEWGIREEGYAPAVPLKDPSELRAQQQALGLVEDAEMPMPDPETAREALERMADDLPVLVRDHIHNPYPRQLRGGHWHRRAGALEAAGNRDPSALRSFFHYVRELYRLVPASEWLENNMDRLYGTQEVVTAEELRAGELAHGGREIEWMTDEESPATRAHLKKRLGGKLYELTFTKGDGGPRKTAYFRTIADRKKAELLDPRVLIGSREERNAAAADEAAGIEGNGGWKVVDKPFQPKILILGSREEAVNPERPPRAGQVEHKLPEPVEGEEVRDDDVTEDPTTRQVLLPRKFREIMWESEALGRVAYRKGGKMRDIFENMGQEGAREFQDYIDDILRTLTGRNVLGKMDRFATGVASLVRHKVLGLLNPGTAFKEIAETTLANATFGGMGIENAFEASAFANEFAIRLSRAQARLRENPAQWLREHTLRVVDGKTTVRSESILAGLRTPEEKLAKLSPKKRAEREMQDDANVFAYGSFLSGESVMGHLTEGTREYRYGKALTMSGTFAEGAHEVAKEAFSKAVTTADKASWFLRRLAQQHGMMQTLIGAYMTQRRAGVSKAESEKIALHFALAQGNIGSRLAQSEFFQTWLGRLAKPLYSWWAHVSATNWRQFFHHGAKGIGRLAYYGMYVYALQQLGILGEKDITRWVGGSLSDVPKIGPMATWSSHKLQYWMQLAADPANAAGTLPPARQKLVDLAREHAPAFLREYAVRKARTIGSLPDLAILPLWGANVPMQVEQLGNLHEAAVASFQGDAKKARDAWYKTLIGNFWYAKAANELFGRVPDPTDPNYYLTKSPATGVTQSRVKGEAIGRILSNLIGPDIDQAIERIQNNVIAPMRDAMQAAAAKTSSYEMEKVIRRGMTLEREAKTAREPATAEQLLADAKKSREAFRTSFQEHVRAEEMSRGEALAYAKRLSKVATANIALTSNERNIINAYNRDTAFRLMARALDDPAENMNRKRFDLIVSLWYANAKEFNDALKSTSKETRELFTRSSRAAMARWKAQADQPK